MEHFVQAHQSSYAQALKEIKSGWKQSHWMWFIFPQVKGLGRSSTAEYYGIDSLQEALLFLKHPVLGSHLQEISRELLFLESSDAYAIFGSPDELKLHSSMTLFVLITEEDSVFQQVLEKFFQGAYVKKTLKILGIQK